MTFARYKKSEYRLTAVMTCKSYGGELATTDSARNRCCLEDRLEKHQGVSGIEHTSTGPESCVSTSSRYLLASKAYRSDSASEKFRCVLDVGLKSYKAVRSSFVCRDDCCDFESARTKCDQKRSVSATDVATTK